MRISRQLALSATTCAVLLLAACGSGAGEASATEAPAGSAAPAAAQGADAEPGFEDVPTVDELDARLATEVTEANADAEFEKLQAELAAEDDG
jgi:hypothetical protein